MDTTAGDAVYRFEGFMIDVARGLLLHDNGEEVQLRHKSFELLHLFVENPGSLLDRDRINQAIWPDVIVNDNGVAQCVRDVRLALHDDAQTIIRTVPRRGYIFTSKVTAVARQPGSRSTADALPLPDKPSIAVLAFANMGGDPEQEYFSDGIADDIITELSRIRWLFVIARNSSFTYKGSAIDVKRIGRELGVRYVLEGSVRRGGDRVRVNAQLIDAETGAHVWAERYDRDLSDVFAVQDEITASVIAAIEPNLRAAETERARRKPMGSFQAYDLTLRALPRLYGLTRDGLDDAARLLREAIAIDPSYAPALAYLSYCLWMPVSQNWIDGSDPSVAGVVQLAKDAVALDPDDPEVLALAGYRIAHPGGDLSGGIALQEKAVRLNPNNAQAWRNLGQLYAYAGDKEKAIGCFERASRLNPVSQTPAFHTGYVIAHFVAGEYEAAVEWSAKALRHIQNSAAVLRYRAASLGLLGRLEEGRETVRRLLELVPNFTIARARRHIEFDMNNAFKTPGVADSFYEGLRSAGVPE